MFEDLSILSVAFLLFLVAIQIIRLDKYWKSDYLKWILSISCMLAGIAIMLDLNSIKWESPARRLAYIPLLVTLAWLLFQKKPYIFKASRQFSEKFSQQLFDNTKEMIFTLDRNFRLVQANIISQDITGFGISAFEALSIYKIVFPEDQIIVSRVIRSLIKGSNAEHCRIRIINRTGEIKHLQLTLVPLRNKSGEIMAFQGIARDATKEYRNLERVRLLADVITSSEAPIIIFNNDGNIKVWNKGAEKITGIPRARAVSRTYGEIFPNQPDLMLEVEANGGSYSCETEIKPADSSIPVLINCYRVGEGISPEGYALILQDLRKQRILEDRLQQQQRIEALGKLAGGIAHDFNNLLTIINGNAAMLYREIDPETKQFRYVKGIMRASDRGAKLVEQLLAFGRRQKFKPRKVHLREIVEDAIDLLKHGGWGDISFVTSFDPDLMPLFVDPGRMHQVLMNLLVNARDAMPNGGTVRVSVSRREIFSEDIPPDANATPGSHQRLTIEDQGVGMDKDTLLHLFEPFYTTKGAKGTGLGLATVHGIIRQHQGWIDVKSSPGEGSTFSIYLPLTQIVELDKNEKDQPTRTRTSSPILDDANKSQTSVRHHSEKIIHEELRGKETILLVDDEELVREIYGNVLEMYGYRVLLASNGVEALEHYYKEKDSIDIAILDLIMPEMGGKELLQRFKKLKPELPILIQSGIHNQAVRESNSNNNVRGFLPKPFLPESLLTEVRRVLDVQKQK